MEYRVSGNGWEIVFQDCTKTILEKDLGNGKIQRIVLIK